MECAIALGIIGNKESLFCLQQMAEDKEELVRKYAAESIKKINSQPNEPD